MTTRLARFVAKTLRGSTAKLADNITANNALLNRLMERQKGRPKPKPLTKAQIAKRERDRKRGEKYLRMAHDLGVYEEPDDRDY